jgi:GNAT superfamily N-acetyltransferase
VTDSRTEARDHCSAIAQYDKLRLLLRGGGLILALAEFSFDLVATDIVRFTRYGVTLRAGHDCRWGLCVRDEWQGRGVGTALAAPSFELARRFGRDRVILWGGVQSANAAAVRYYRKIGFTEIGQFTNDQGLDSIDMLRALAEPTAA